MGEASHASLSESQEARIGRAIMREIRESRDYLDDPVLTDYLNRLGDRLAVASSDTGRRFEFFAVKDASINAFALPGGFIGVHTGLISAARTESELAGVLAHEIAHVTQKHIARMVDAQKTSTLTSLAALAIAILAARSNSQMAEAALVTSQALSLQSQLNFTRENEREADRIGLQTLNAAGFSPQGMGTFFERLQAQGRLYESNSPAYMRTHPLTFERIADMENRLGSMPYRQHEDSAEFRYVRARVQADEDGPGEAVRRFEARTQEHDDAEVAYALARAALRENDVKRARAAYARLAKLDAASPQVALLQGEILMHENRSAEAASWLANTLKRGALFSDYRPLAYLYAQALLRAQQPAQAQDFLARQQKVWPSDLRFLALSAECHQALGQPVRAYLDRAEVFARQDRLDAAIEQLEHAQQQKGVDFYTLSIVDARLRDLRERRSREREK